MPLAKRARLSIPAEETQQVKSLNDHKLDLPDADVFYVPQFIDPSIAQKYYDQILALDDWYNPVLKMYGKEVIQSRKIAGPSHRSECNRELKLTKINSLRHRSKSRHKIFRRNNQNSTLSKSFTGHSKNRARSSWSHIQSLHGKSLRGRQNLHWKA